jgi:hypothetical protein
LGARVALGALAWPTRGRFFPHADVGLDLSWEPFALAVRFGGHTRPTVRGADYEVSGTILEGGLALRVWLFDAMVGVGVSAQLRATLLEFRGAANDTGQELRVFWIGGMGFELLSLPLRWSGWRFGPNLSVSIWPNPGRFLIRGEPVAREEYAELTLTWVAAWDGMGFDF